jgi:hypothetical protein
MVINTLQNKRNGPGGSARRLHQNFFVIRALKPGYHRISRLLWGRNRIDVRSKIKVFARHCTTVIGLILQMQTIMKHLR